MTTPETPPATDTRSRFEQHPAGTKEKAFLLYRRHTELSMISMKLGVCLATLRKWSSVGKWKSRRILLEDAKPGNAFPPEKPCGQEAERDHAFEELIALPLGQQQSAYQRMMTESAMRIALTMQRSTDSALVQQADKWAKLDTTARKALGLEANKVPVIVNVALLAGMERGRPPSLPCAGAADLAPVQVH
jgi:hypothetical protein